MKEKDAEEIKREIICFQFSERIKSEIIIASSLLTKLGGLKDDELVGAKKLMSSFLDGVIMEINLAHNVLRLKDFLMARKKVIEIKEINPTTNKNF